MAQRKPAQVHGLLVIDKPAGWTSRDVVNKVSGLLGEKRVGHAGTLDPMATGILLIAFGEATKGVRWWQDAAKTYETTVRFGAATLSDDSESPVLRTAKVPALTEEMILGALPPFGEVMQVPPAVSALQRGGVRDHARVRKGEIVVRDPRPVKLESVEVLGIAGAEVQLRVTCGAGFYIRALGRDLGEALQSAAHLAGLRRTSGGGYGLGDAIGLEAFQKLPDEERFAHLRPLPEALGHVLPTLTVDDALVLAFRQGKQPVLPTDLRGDVLILDEQGRAVCVVVAHDDEAGARLVVERGFVAPDALAPSAEAAEADETAEESA
jgi:tRNA pseudouridine55 synthase